MNKTAALMLEYNKVKNRLLDFAVSDLGKKAIAKLEPSLDINVILANLLETTEAKAIINISSSVPLLSLEGMENIMSKCSKESLLTPGEFTTIYEFLKASNKMKSFMKGKEYLAPRVCAYAYGINELEVVREEIYKCIDGSRVSDNASSQLAKIRKKIAVLEGRIKTKLDNIMKSSTYKKYLQENIVSIRGEHYVIPVKSEYKNYVKGNIMDSSASGSTIFIEPAEIHRIQQDLAVLKFAEDNEEKRILMSLQNLIEEYQREIAANIEVMGQYDFAFAKAKYSRAIDGNPVKLNENNYINIIKGNHPLLGKEAVPLDICIGQDYRALIITGPNTGGKTVALKTTGLLTMMVQSGLHVPADKESDFAVFADILTDIGDGQNLEQSLSTFSSHISNIKSILECADARSLVILDELGAGTDPGEGRGLAVAILESLFKKGAVILATTHYSELKDFAENTPGFENGCMEFNINTLKPLYKLIIGASGASNAFLIALRLGLNNKIIERAHEITYNEKKEYKDISLAGNNVENREIKASHQNVKFKQQKIAVRKKQKKHQETKAFFNIGDCVYINSVGGTGIVCEMENAKGEVGVMYKKKKLKVNKKRLSLYIEAKELYPEDYDMDIIFENKENRKKSHLMGRKYVKDLTIEREYE